MPDDADGYFAQFMIFTVRQGLAGSDHNTLTGVDAHGIKILHVADRNAVISAVAHHLVFDLLPAGQVFLDQNLRGVGKGFLGFVDQFFAVAADARAQPAKGIGHANHEWITNSFGDLNGLGNRAGHIAGCGFDVDFAESLNELFAVFRIDDRLCRRTQNGDLIFPENTPVKQFQTGVERRLAAKTEQYPPGLFLLDDGFDIFRRYRDEINAVGQVPGGLDGGDVGIDQNGRNPLLFQGFDGLAAGVVKFTGLTDLEGGAAQDEHFIIFFGIHLRRHFYNNPFSIFFKLWITGVMRLLLQQFNTPALH